ncbi:MAG TPA: glycosyltransferase family 1 protein [Firmicutes bacterium]|nr:glycosyltransferase family 1 protein [Bacillota bacterium]
MRVLHLNFEKTWRGGESQVMHLVRGLRELGVDNELCTYPGSDLFKNAVGNGFKAYELASINELDIISSYLLSKIIRSGKFDIIHVHTSHSHTIGLIALKILKDPPKLIMSRRVDFEVGKNFFSRMKYNSPVISRIIAISEGVKNVLVHSGLEESKIDVVYSGINISEVKSAPVINDIRAEFNIPPGKKIIGNVAALAPHKDHATLLRAVKILKMKFNDFILIIFGEGLLRAGLEELVNNLDISDYVIFAGFRQEIISYMKQFDYFVISSKLEGLCTSLIDALSCGVPVAATETGGIPEVIINDFTGLLAKPEDPEDLSDILFTLINQPELCRKFRENGLVHADKFDFSNTVRTTFEVYKKVLGNDV